MDNRSTRQQQHAEPAGGRTWWTEFPKFTFEQLTRLLLKISSDFCAVELFKDDKSSRPSEWWWPRWARDLVRGLYFYLTAKFLIYICLQYIYDFDWYEYEALLRETIAATTSNNHTGTGYNPTNTTTGNHRLQLLEQAIERDIGRLKFLGAPFIKFHFSSEPFYIYVTWAVFVVYLRPQLYFRYVRPFDFSLLRAVLDWKREQLYCDQIVQNEVNKFHNSSRTFVQFCARFAGFNSGQLLANSARTSEQLERMVLGGSLKPFNRSSAWIKRISNLMGYFCLWFSIGVIILVLSLLALTVLSSLVDESIFGTSEIEMTGPMDMLALAESVIFVGIGLVSVNLYLTVTAFNTFDQIQTINRLNRLIETCIRSNTQTFWRNRAPFKRSFTFITPGSAPASLNTTRTAAAKTQPESVKTTTTNQQDNDDDDDDDDDDEDEGPKVREVSRCCAQMNNKLLFVMMSYKIYVSQVKSTRRTYSFVVISTAELMILGPMLSMAHAQYMTTSLLYLAVCCCMTLIMWGDTSLAPCCYLYSRHLKTYRALHNLLAHTVALRCAAASTVDLYDSHTVLILRKELSDPDLLLKQFAITLLGVHFTYTNFLKIHFWCGILAILGYYATGPNKGGVFVETMRFF